MKDHIMAFDAGNEASFDVRTIQWPWSLRLQEESAVVGSFPSGVSFEGNNKVRTFDSKTYFWIGSTA